MTEEARRGSGGLPPRLKILLVASLALNLLILGAAGGAVMTWGHGGGHTAHHSGIGGPLTRALRPQDRRVIGMRMHRILRDVHGQQDARRADFAGLIADLRQVPFEPEAVALRLSRHREVLAERLELGQSLLLERLSAMSDAERAAFADRVTRKVSERRPRWH